MKRNKTIGKALIICGCILSLLGINLVLVKGHSIVSFMSLPIIFLGIIIWTGAEKTSSTPEDGLKDT